MAKKSTYNSPTSSADSDVELKRLMLYCTELEFQNRQLRDNQIQLEKHAQSMFRQFFEAPVGLLEMDGFGVIRHVNQTAQTLVGRPARKLEKHVITEFVHPQDRKTITDLFSKARRLGVAQHAIRMLEGDGTERKVDAILRCTQAEDGDQRQVHASMMLIDRPEQNQHQRDNDLKAEELHHRMKNDLALVDGIVEQCLRENTGLMDVRAKIRGRLKALASSHVAMDLGRRGGCSLSLLIEHTLKPFDQMQQIHYLDAAHDTILPSHMVTPLALTLHEIASLSIEQGALAMPHGQIHLDVARQTHTWVLTWREQGKPTSDQATPNPAHSIAQASSLARKLVEYQMNGEISFESLDDGLRVMICLPTESVKT